MVSWSSLSAVCSLLRSGWGLVWVEEQANPKEGRQNAPPHGPVDKGGWDAGVEIHLRRDRHVHDLSCHSEKEARKEGVMSDERESWRKRGSSPTQTTTIQTPTKPNHADTQTTHTNTHIHQNIHIYPLTHPPGPPAGSAPAACGSASAGAPAPGTREVRAAGPLAPPPPPPRRGARCSPR